MADILLDEQGNPTSPASGQGLIYFDNQISGLVQKNDAGKIQGDDNKATLAQIAAHSADTYYLGLQMPSGFMQAGAFWKWEIVATKGAAGTAAPIFTFRTGTNGTTADTSRLAITMGVQTAVADTAYITCLLTCRSVGASGVVQGSVWIQHNLQITGFATTPSGFSLTQGTSAGFDNTALGGHFMGLSVNPGTAGAWVVEQVVLRAVYA